jgi:hypothetical protein
LNTEDLTEKAIYLIYLSCDPCLGKDLSHKPVDFKEYPRSDAYLVSGTKTKVYIDAVKIQYVVFLAKI